MRKTVLITGGAGFIGSFLTDELVRRGDHVIVFDNLEDQVHRGRLPAYMNRDAEFVKGDVRDREAFASVARRATVVFHLAARVGVGQSNYQIKDYGDVNIGGMANLLDICSKEAKNIEKILMTASMTSYGEGDYHCPVDGRVVPTVRARHETGSPWDPPCPVCSRAISPIPTAERSALNNNSIYSLTKSVQESLMHQFGRMYNVPTVSFRCFNVFGPRQSLSNPYTGVAAIFISRMKNGNPPVVYEDGMQTRDFISVHDVVAALVEASIDSRANYRTFNMGSGRGTQIIEIARTIAELLGAECEPSISEQFRANDIRHCTADTSSIQSSLGWKPRVSLQEGMSELIKWAEREQSEDLFDRAEAELRERKFIGS